MDAAIRDTWEAADEAMQSAPPIEPRQQCCTSMCTEPGVMRLATEGCGPTRPSVTPLDGVVCTKCAGWEVVRASVSGAWAGRDPRIYLAYAKAGLCVSVQTGVGPLDMHVEEARRLRGRLDEAFGAVFGPAAPVTPPPPSPDLVARCLRDL
jgi:hypothetical protein